MQNIVILISGRGSNFEAILRTSREENWESACNARIAAVISNRPQAAGLDIARAAGIEAVAMDHKAYDSREAFEAELADIISRYDPAVIVLAGFMRVLTEGFVSRFEGKILNIHPALLPLFPGLNTHQRAIDAGCRVHGSTVHFVTAVLDGGSIIGQAVVPVLPSDDADALAHRGLVYEHQLYPKCVRAILEGRVRCEDGRTVWPRRGSGRFLFALTTAEYIWLKPSSRSVARLRCRSPARPSALSRPAARSASAPPTSAAARRPAPWAATRRARRRPKSA